MLIYEKDDKLNIAFGTQTPPTTPDVSAYKQGDDAHLFIGDTDLATYTDEE